MPPMDRPHQLAQFLKARRARVRPEDVGLPRSIAVARRGFVVRRSRCWPASAPATTCAWSRAVTTGRLSRCCSACASAATRRQRHRAPVVAGPPRHPGRATGPGGTPGGRVGPAGSAGLLGHHAGLHPRPLARCAGLKRAGARVDALSEPGTNLLRSWFLDPEDRRRYDDVEFVLTQAVAYFRATVAGHRDDPYVQNLIDELSRNSDEFRRIWDQHDVQPGLSGEGPLYHHPVLGALRLRYQTFAVTGTEGLTLYVVSAAPGSRDAQALTLLSTIAADDAAPISAPPLSRATTDGSAPSEHTPRRGDWSSVSAELEVYGPPQHRVLVHGPGRRQMLDGP